MSNVSEPQPFQMASAMKIGHVSLNVSDLPRSLEFYQEILGFKAVGRPSGERALLSAGGSPHLVELLQAKRDPSGPRKRAGLYHFAILLPERRHLADMLGNLRRNRDRVHLDGLADHLVSEAVYIRDPDFIGIEIYRDRPQAEWSWDGGRVGMATMPLDTGDLLKESTEKGWEGMPHGTAIGHVHLHVRDLPRAIKFYHEILGLSLTATYPGAYFFAAGRYHHHVAANTWLGTDILPALPESVGLRHFGIELPSRQEYERLAGQLSGHGMDIDGALQDMDGTRVLVQHR